MDNELIKAESAIIAAAIGAVVTIITLFITPGINKRFHVFKLKTEYRYDQQKKIKEQLSKNKMQFLNLAETLYYRLRILNENVDEPWMNVKENYIDRRNTFFVSTVYRIAAFFAWIKKIENDMIYIDVTIASKEDLYFIKYLKLLQLVFCDHSIFDGYEYDKNYARDHFFRNNFERMIESLLEDDNICEFSYFEENLKEFSKKLDRLCWFLDGINPFENRYRWDVLQLFQLTLIGFLNSYGYDFQYTDKDNVEQMISLNRPNKFLKNYLRTINKMKMGNQKELKKIMNVARKYDITSNKKISIFSVGLKL